jgi:hypothetical protein
MPIACAGVANEGALAGGRSIAERAQPRAVKTSEAEFMQ